MIRKLQDIIRITVAKLEDKIDSEDQDIAKVQIEQFLVCEIHVRQTNI